MTKQQGFLDDVFVSQDKIFELFTLGELDKFNQSKSFNTLNLLNLTTGTTAKNNNISHLPICNCFVHQVTGNSNNIIADTVQPQFSSALFGNNNPNTSTWIAGLNSGSRWSFTGSGTPTLTYSFFNGGTYYGDETGVTPLSATAQNFTRRIFADIQSLINVNFTEVADTQNSYGQIRLQLSSDPSYAYAYYPSRSLLGGDIHLNTSYDNANNTNGWQRGIGSHGYMSIIHEIGHALGLKHPGNYNGSTGTGSGSFLTYADDNTGNTVMSYNFTGNSAATFMPFDILTLQSIYGARTTNQGNTTYTFTSLSNYSDGAVTWGNGTASKLTIWDSSGTDTLNFGSLANNSNGYRFDLNEGGWLSTRSGFNTLSYTAYGDASKTPYYTTATGTRLAYDVNIENLIGSNNNDEIFGNALTNSLNGGGGMIRSLAVLATTQF
jgi:serralysin